ncbi:N-6 DNA methylase [Gloeothece citriformis PCC 7424]|uniref:N-6 DNA methylase n=1 Tax=Gloeothece citriformis (strain PCC 7424) TaxID=65393 RepID=B7KIM1_GLOC7|nr:N-6 DNA methylase [Gloeothece citriformis]ACK69427.1 N-6 DNA methylase [Gloeothece citriformis PCC 7424]
MTWKQAIQRIVNSEKNKIVNIDLEKSSVEYTDTIHKWENPKIIKGDEEIVRAFLVNRLINVLDYRPELIEIEKPYTIGRPKVSRGEIDIIVKDNKDDVFFFIEVKSPTEYEKDKKNIKGQLFDLAKQEKNVHYLVYYTCEYQENKVVDKAIIIDFKKYKQYEDWENTGQISVGNELSPGYNKPKKQPKIKGDSSYDLVKDLNRDTLNSLATDLHNVLWGGGGTSDTEIFYSLVNIILAKIQDESEKEDGQEYGFQIYAYGDNIESSDKVFERINLLYRRALSEKLNISDQKRLEKSYVINEDKFPLNKLIYTIQSLENYSFIEGRSSLDGRDILGDFFEQIIRDGFKQTKGQFFTPTSIVKFVLYALQIDQLAIECLNQKLELPFICDPACGSGTFLIEAMKIITKEIKYKQKDKVKTSRQVKDRFDDFFQPDHKENRWAERFLYGIEINFDLGTASKVNMILHGDGASNIFVMDGLLPFRFYTKDKVTSTLQIYKNDSLYFQKEVNEEFDIVISNPPFSVDLDNQTKNYLNRIFLYGTKKNSKNLFIERWYQILKDRGRLGVVLPESVFDTTENKYIRLFLFKYFNVKAVVSLPQITFEPYTSTKTSLLFAQKKTKTEIEQWTKLWEQYGKEWSTLKNKVSNYIKVYVENKNQNNYSSIKDDNEKTIKTNLLRYLKNYIIENDKKLSIIEILEKYSNEIQENSKFDQDIKDTFGYYNPWWVFNEVAQHFHYENYEIFMAEVSNVGYKRTKRGEKNMPNELYDEEVAPMFIDKEKIINGYHDQISWFENLKNELEEEKKVLEHKLEQTQKKTKKASEKLEKLQEDIKGCESELNKLHQEKLEVEKIIETYYERGNRSNEWRIKPEYYDRTDKNLLDNFINGLLKNYYSSDVLIRRSNPIKILDFIRKEVIW